MFQPPLPVELQVTGLEVSVNGKVVRTKPCAFGGKICSWGLEAKEEADGFEEGGLALRIVPNKKIGAGYGSEGEAFKDTEVGKAEVFEHCQRAKTTAPTGRA